MLKKFIGTLTLSAIAMNSFATTDIEWWHAMGGALGETVNTMAQEFNASQTHYRITPVFKGSYEETMTAGISAFRAGEAPHIIQIFDAGAATIINAKGAAVPVQTVMENAGYKFDMNDYISGVRYFYADAKDLMVGMPFNASTPVLYYNKGLLTPELIALSLDFCKSQGIKTVVDPKKANFLAYRGVSLFKPNLKEIREALNLDLPEDKLQLQDLEHAALALEQAKV